MEFEPVLFEQKPDWVLVVGDVNSTIACALVCSKLGIKIAHVEAGLRSRDRTMPEEINRILTDAISDLLLTTSQDADENLLAEGIAQEKIRFVGNVMIDSLREHLELSTSSNIREGLKLTQGKYAVVTLHRPSNVDDRTTLSGIMNSLMEIAKDVPVVFPVHPRTRAKIHDFEIETDGVTLTEPLGYLDFMRLYSGAKLVLTDSGGLQEETTVLGIPCLTLRENTERPITIEMGTNILVGTNPEKIKAAAFAALDDDSKHETKIPPLWDGKAAGRICDELLR